MAKQPLLLRRERLADFTVPAAGGRGLIEIDTAKNVWGVKLVWGTAGGFATYANMCADIGDIRVRVAGKLILEATGTELLDLYHYYNDRTSAALTDAGVLPIWFIPYGMPDSREVQQYAVGMLSDTDKTKRNTFSIEVNMLSPGGGLTVTTCEVQLYTDDEPAQQIGYHCRLLPYGTTWAAASQQTLDQIPHESNALAVLGYHVHHTAGTLTRMSLTVDDYERIRDVPRTLWLQDLNLAGRSPVANYEHIDFALHNDPESFLDISKLVNEYLRLTWSVAPTGYRVLVHQLCKNIN